MTNVIREITKEDFETCAKNLVAAYSGYPWHNTWTFEEALLRIETTMSGINARGFVLEVDGIISGMCLGRIDYYFDNWRQFCIDEFNISPTLQGKGFGSHLLDYVASIMKNDDINQLFLMTGGIKAATFYKKNGFSTSNESTMMERHLPD